MESVPYSSIVGSIMYTMICTRPDLAHAISVTSRYMSDPGKEHWNALEWILRYLRNSSNCGILFKGSDKECEEAVLGIVMLIMLLIWTIQNLSLVSCSLCMVLS